MMKKTSPELADFLSHLHKNMRGMLATDQPRPGYTTTLEYISLAGEHYFPPKEDTLALRGKAVRFFNAAAVYIEAEGADQVRQALPKSLPAGIEDELDKAGFYKIAALVKKYGR